MNPGQFILAISLLVLCNAALAQFSPGELSRGHKNLEGTQNCTRCHDVGKVIIGTKCLSCHREIQSQIENKRGYHYTLVGEPCVKCHKEHLGRNAKTIRFEERSFDHRQTGFILDGSHTKLACNKCHNESHIRDSVVKTLISTYPHQSYMGLRQECKECHKDVHKGRFTQDCSSCHGTSAWKDADKFVHSKAKFPLSGKHTDVKCNQCHTFFKAVVKTETIDFTTKPFSDCTPCHPNPHRANFSDRNCQSCHITAGWKDPLKKGFDHNLTAFKLIGKHAQVKCAKCHTQIINGKSTDKLHLAFKKCTDCHDDKHESVFTAKFSNDCALCHDEQGYIPSTFTLTRHNESRFLLIGAHAAVLCSNCHRDRKANKLIFRFEDRRCITCHRDPHRSQFDKIMGDAGCVKCHSTNEWKLTSFDHDSTAFPLKEKHARIACRECHREILPEKTETVINKVDKQCESCHKEIHNGQFAISGKTDCITCHREDSWKKLIFNHDAQSSFSLTGAHTKVACSGCHRIERSNEITFVRYKPLSKKCESCHQTVK